MGTPVYVYSAATLERHYTVFQTAFSARSALIAFAVKANSNLSVLKTNKARAIRFTTLDALCRELKCQPGELLEFVPGLQDETGDTGSDSV